MSNDKKYAVVFDMNGVLFSKNEPGNDDFEIKHVSCFGGRPLKLFLNKNLNCLARYFNTHNSFHKIVWTNMMHKNCHPVYLELVNKYGLPFEYLYSQENCKTGKMVGNIKTIFCIKDLTVPAFDLNVKPENCILIDDSIGKSVSGQNFFHFGQNENSMIEALKRIDEFINCENENCFIKYL